MIVIFQQKSCFECGQKWYLYTLLKTWTSKKVRKYFLGKICFSFFIIDIFLWTLQRALSIWCLKLSFSSMRLPRCFWLAVFSIWILLRIMNRWIDTFAFLENKTYWVGFLEPVLKIIFEIKVHFQIRKGIGKSICIFILISDDIQQRGVISLSWSLNLWVNHYCSLEKQVATKFSAEEHLLQ